MKIRLSLALLYVSISCSQVPPTVQPLILEHANIIDPSNDTLLLDQTVVLTAGKIRSITSAPVVTEGERIDLGGAWVLPGLLDAHVHVMNIAAARRMLSLGITTGRSMFATSYLDVGLRTLRRHGAMDIPTILASGYPVLSVPVRFRPDMTAMFLDHPDLDDLRKQDRIRPDGAGRLVRALAGRKLDWIKVFANERAGLLDTDPSDRNLNDAELNVAVTEATRLGLPVAAHAYSDEGVSAAVRAGVRSVEHGELITEPTLKLMLDRGTFLVPTLYGFALPPGSTTEDRALQPRIENMLKRGRQAVAMAKRLGVRIVAGADSGYEDGEPTVIDEIIQLASVGLSNLEAIRSATSVSAECLEMASAKGAIRPGWDADLVAYDDNPMSNLAVMRKPVLVVVGGNIFLRKSPS